tara:strand:- start:569 stop:706 length:138 start_codon:yes stop_codon:yes gene_type:complete
LAALALFVFLFPFRAQIPVLKRNHGYADQAGLRDRRQGAALPVTN